MTAKKMGKKLKSDYMLISRGSKLTIFSTIAFILTVHLIYTNCIVSSISFNPIDLTTTKKLPLDQHHDHKISHINPKPSAVITSSPDHDHLQNINGINVEDNNDPDAIGEKDHDRDLLQPPENITKEERITWFRRKLPGLEILNSTELAQKFHGRVLEFLNNNCSLQFYMVWLSPTYTFTHREFLSIDTLFKTNQGSCLIIISRSMDSRHGYIKLKPFLDRGLKVAAITPDVPFLVKNTPAQVWLENIKSGTKDPGYIPLTMNLSNLIRLAMLYKYGGIYIDSDFIFLKDFSGLRNSVGAQSIDLETKNWTRLNGAVLVFDLGHPLLHDFLEEFAKTFNGNKWGHNGPYLVSRVVERVGDTYGYNVTVLPPEAFYPVNWVKIRRLFKRPVNVSENKWAESMFAQLKDGDTYAVHLWNKRSKDLKIEEGCVLGRLITDHCVICEV